MPKQKILKTTIILIFISFFLAGCIKLQVKQSDGGIYKSEDNAITWKQKAFIFRTKKRIFDISNTNILTTVFDPKDNDTFYIGTLKNGAYVTHNNGEKFDPIPNVGGQIRNIVINHENNKVLYFSVNNKVVKTTNKGATWKLMFTESSGSLITNLAIDPKNSDILYLGTAHGEVLKTKNGAQSWTVIKSFGNKVAKILINPKKPNRIYVATVNTLYKSINGGLNWFSFDKKFKNFRGTNNFYKLALDETVTDGIIYASKYGLLRSRDGGLNWKEIPIISIAPFHIYSIIQNSKDKNEIYYGTAKNLFRTIDGGKSWTTISMPSSRIPNQLILDPTDSSILYMGVFQLQNQTRRSSLFLPS